MRWRISSSKLASLTSCSYLPCTEKSSDYSTGLKLASLRTVIVAGESCALDVIERHEKVLPDAALYNEYGPTEATVWTTVYKHQARSGIEQVPIGKPISGSCVIIVDDHRQPVPVGVPGELCIGGAGVARGYWRRPDLTAERFIPDPRPSSPNGRVYRTGDIGRYLLNGSIEFLGRKDHQVKIRGSHRNRRD